MQTISHNLQYKMEKAHFNLDRHILCIPIYWIRGTLWTSFYSDKALQTKTLTKWCRPLHIIYITKWRKPFGILIDTSLLYQYIWIRGNCGQVSTLMRLCKRTLTNCSRPFPIIYNTKWRKCILILIDISSVYPYIG